MKPWTVLLSFGPLPTIPPIPLKVPSPGTFGPAFRDLQALSDSLSFATLPTSLLSSFLNLLRHVSLLVLLHPTPVRCLNRSFEYPFNIWYQFDFRGNSSHAFI